MGWTFNLSAVSVAELRFHIHTYIGVQWPLYGKSLPLIQQFFEQCVEFQHLVPPAWRPDVRYNVSQALKELQQFDPTKLDLSRFWGRNVVPAKVGAALVLQCRSLMLLCSVDAKV